VEIYFDIFSIFSLNSDINVAQPSYIGLLIGFTGADGNEIQSEYFIPYKYAVPALKAACFNLSQISPLV
jgi:hypothetical protein